MWGWLKIRECVYIVLCLFFSAFRFLTIIYVLTELIHCIYVIALTRRWVREGEKRYSSLYVFVSSFYTLIYLFFHLLYILV